MSTRNEEEICAEIRREHEQLRALLGNISREFQARAPAIGAVAKLMSTLESHVQQHFQEEEEGGFFHEVVCQAPRLAERADAIKSEHAELAAAVARCVKMAAEEEILWNALESEFHEFSKSLMHHESKENELLLDAYDQDIGLAD